MTTADVNVSCPHCRQEYRLRIDLERLMRLRSRVVCSRCRKAFDVASRLGARSAGRASLRPSASRPPEAIEPARTPDPRAEEAPAARVAPDITRRSTQPGFHAVRGEEAASAQADAADASPPAKVTAPVAPSQPPFRPAVEVDARPRRETEPPLAPKDVLDSLRTIPPEREAKPLGRMPLGAPPPPTSEPRRPLGVPPPLPTGPRRRITPKMFPAVVDVAEVPSAPVSIRQPTTTSPPPAAVAASETPPPGPTQPSPESVAQWMQLADPGLRALAPQHRPASAALARLLSR